MTTGAGIIETVMQWRVRTELGPHADQFLMATDPANRELVLQAMTPKYAESAPGHTPLWRASDGPPCYLLADMRLIALRQKLDRTIQ